MYQLTLDAQTSWVVLALIAFLAGYYVQIINRLKDFPLDDPRRQSPKYYPMMTWLSWMAAILFITIFALIIRITLVLPLHLRVIFDHINIAIIIGSFALSQAIHLGVFLRSYGEDMMRYFRGSPRTFLDDYRREGQAYEKAAKSYEEGRHWSKAREAWKKAAESYEAEAEVRRKRRPGKTRILVFRILLIFFLALIFITLLLIILGSPWLPMKPLAVCWIAWGVLVVLHKYVLPY